MLKITDKPQYKDFEDTTEVMDMFRHAIHSEFTLEWVAGALAHLDIQRLHNKALYKAIDIWFSDNEEDKVAFAQLFDRVDRLTFLFDMRNKIKKERESERDD